MKVFAGTLTHLDISLVTASLARIYETSHKAIDCHVLLDHHWPIDYWKHRHAIMELAEKYGCKVMSPFQNLGGHGGFSWLVQNIPMTDEDLVLGIDGDSFPVTPGWDMAMKQALVDDKSLAAISLKLNADLFTKIWDHERTASGIGLMRPGGNGIEMYNATMWRGSFLRSVGGMLGGLKFYGGVEMVMRREMDKRGLRHAYLSEFCEQLRPFDADPRYQQWKVDHIHGYQGNFDQWLAEKSPK